MATKKNTSTTSAKMSYMYTLPTIGTSTAPAYQAPQVVEMTPQQKYERALYKYNNQMGNDLTQEEVALLNNPPSATAPATLPTVTAPVTATDTTVPVGTSANANQLMDYTNAIAAADAALGKAGIVNTLQLRKAQAAGDLATRTAERDIYYAKQNALNQLAQRGISGSPGLRTAAERAAIVAPTTQRLQAINTMTESQRAANLLLAEETAKRQQAIQDANTTLTKVTNITNQLGGKP